ncbi:MAG: cytochrome C [Betaproteobacteria bacterium]|nr:MAG: cytochrome C [Betaproteobacteria bacterium]
MLRTVIALFAVCGLASAGIAGEVTYRKDIRPLWVQKCAQCHGAEAPYLGDFEENKKKFEAMLVGPRMDTYADLVFFIGWPDTGALMRRLDDGKATSDGKPGNMYTHLGDSDEERRKNLDLFKQWVGKDAWKLNRWKARGKVPAITKEELDRIEAKY